MHPFHVHMRVILRVSLWTLFALLAVLSLSACDLNVNPPGAEARYIPNDWRTGSIVRLAAGTEVREGPAIGYCWHTRAPLDQWAVQVTGGPRTANGHLWYEVSRAAVGDAAGGAGWVDSVQADHAPATQYGGIQCTASAQQTQPGPNGDWLTQLLMTIQAWWLGLSTAVRAVAVVVTGVVLLALVVAFPRTSSLRISLLKALLAALLVWGVAEQGRIYWEDWWISLTGLPAPGFPVLLALLAMAWWAFREWGHSMKGVPRLLALLLLLVLAVYLIAPQPVDQWVAYSFDWITGRKG